MNISEENSPNVQTLHFNSEEMVLLLEDGRKLSVPLWWYPRLAKATKTEREKWEFCGGGMGIHWPMIDEDISIAGMLQGWKAPDARPLQ